MKLRLVFLALMAGLLMVPAGAEVFPYPYRMVDLDNGLRLIVVPIETQNTVALQIVMRVGSRNEVEPGKSGFAHFFEHLMFRGTPRFSSEKAASLLKSAGVSGNAWTWDDLTVYHKVFSKEDLETILDYEADRFQNLDYPAEDFKTEALAVLGEYNKNSSNPTEKLFARAQDTAFERHTYKHTTMGFLGDVENMPQQYEYSKQFFQRYYRPEYATVVLVGDLEADRTIALVKKYFGPWKRGDFAPEIPVEPVQKEPKEAKVEWGSATLPWVFVAYKAPAYSQTEAAAAMQVWEALAFSHSSALYQELVVNQQKVDKFEPVFWNHRDPYLVGLMVRIKDPAHTDQVRERIVDYFENLKARPLKPETLKKVQSRLRYQFALNLDSAQAIASTLADFIGLDPTPETINRFYQAVGDLDSDRLRAIAAAHFRPSARTVVTLTEAQK